MGVEEVPFVLHLRRQECEAVFPLVGEKETEEAQENQSVEAHANVSLVLQREERERERAHNCGVVVLVSDRPPDAL